MGRGVWLIIRRPMLSKLNNSDFCYLTPQLRWQKFKLFNERGLCPLLACTPLAVLEGFGEVVGFDDVSTIEVGYSTG